MGSWAGLGTRWDPSQKGLSWSKESAKRTLGTAVSMLSEGGGTEPGGRDLSAVTLVGREKGNKMEMVL